MKNERLDNMPALHVDEVRYTESARIDQIINYNKFSAVGNKAEKYEVKIRYSKAGLDKRYISVFTDARVGKVPDGIVFENQGEFETKTHSKKAKKYSYTKDCEEQPREICDQYEKKTIQPLYDTMKRLVCNYEPEETCNDMEKQHCHKIDNVVPRFSTERRSSTLS